MDNNNNPQTPKKPKRARNSNGTYKKKSETIAVDATLLDKPAGKYSVKKQVTGTTEGQESAGDYSNNKREPVRPNLQGIKTIYH